MYEELVKHVGHEVEVVKYGYGGGSVGVECHTCFTTIIEYKMPDQSLKAKEQEKSND